MKETAYQSLTVEYWKKSIHGQSCISLIKVAFKLNSDLANLYQINQNGLEQIK